MNKLFYHLIFNVARQMVMVVADITTGHRTGPVGQTENSIEKATNSRLRWVIKSITTSLWLTFGMVSFNVQSSTIQADSNAPANQQPTIVNSQNGLPQINIQTPNRDGISRNQYRQFDVDHKGAILNNSSTNVNTQLGGIIQGNDWLAKGQAKIILNEVNSSDPSQLNGFIEVAGKKADVIIANPAGITCNGCGFINADQALLSAGKTLIENGKIKGFAVDKGNINIAGKGYNGNDINYTALIARSVKINAKLHAKDLVITTGKNQLAADGKTILKTDHSAQDEPPEFALDVYALGGMYANRITMRGTEYGVGVRNAGHIAAQAGDISLSADGKITNVGAIIGNQHLAIKSQQIVANGGTLMAEQHINLTAKNAINSTEKGEIVAGENIVAHAEWINSDYGTLFAAGVDSKGKLTSTGSLMVKGQKTVALQGNIVAKQNIVLTGSAIDLSGSAIKAKAMILTATEANIDTKQANILVDNKALLTAKKGLDNQKGQLVANQIVLISPEFINNRQGKLIQQSRFDNRWHTRTLHNQQGEISLVGDTNIVVNELDNQSGRLLIRASKLDIDSQILNNQHGHLTATGKDATHIKANLLTGQQGEILTNGALKLKSQSINLDQATTQAKKIAIQGKNLSHQAGQMRQTGAETGQITLSETLNNQSGNISSQGDLTLNINKLENQQGTIITEKKASLSVVARQSIDNRQGSLIGEKNVFLNTLALTHDDGKLISNQADMLIQTQMLQGRRSNISSNGQLRLTAKEVDLTEANTQADNIQFIVNSLNHNRASLTQLGEQQGSIQVAQQLTNRAGDISANGSFVIKAKQLDNLQGKLITKRGDLQLIINEDINNQAGLITAEQLLMMSNQALFNHQGHLQATNIDINTHQQQFDNSEGRLHALQKLNLHSGKLANQRGVIQSGSNMLIDTHGQQLSNSQTGDQQGIDAQGSLSIYSGVLKNQQGRIFARQQLNIDSQGLDNRQGLVTSQSDIKLNTTQFDNSQGTIKGQLITLDTHGHSLTNLAKTDEQGIFASQRLALKIGELINYQGHIQANDIALDTQQKRVDNRQGEIIADNTLDAKIGELQNVQGRIQAAKKLQLNSHGQLINNNHSQATGGILSGGSLSLESGKLSNQHGQIQGAQTTKLMTLLLDNQQGQIFSANAFSIDTQQQPLLNQKGILEGKGQVELQLGDFINSQAITQGKGGLKIDALRIDNQNGTLLSQSIMNINGLALNNSQGLLKSQQNTALSIRHNIDNQQGQILSAADLTIHGQAINNIKGVIQGLNYVALWAQTQIDNSQGWLKANKKLLISSQKITNLATAQAGKGIEGQQISLDSDSLHNQGGVVRAAQTLDAIIRQQLDNSQGMLSVGSQLNISDDGKGQKLRLANQQGVMVSDGSATIIANQLAGAGKLSAQKELSLSLSQWFENQGYIQAGERLVANFKQGFGNHGLLSSLGDLLLTSSMVINNLSGEINGQKSHISVSGNMRNSGLIDGGLTHISAQSLDNIGSGRIYGDLLALAVWRLINDKQADKSAVIAGRNAVNIAVGDLLNRDHALIYSDGKLVIGQALDDQLQATGRAQSVKNHSANIEAAGDLILATERLENKDIHLQLSDQPLEVSREHFNWFDFGNGRRYKIAPRNGNQTRHAINDDGTLNLDVGIDYESSNRWRMFENGNWTKYFYEYDYQRITHKTQLINRDPALITSGKHLTLNGQQLNNENSRVVAGQNLILTGEELNNQETQGVLRITEKGDTIYRYKGGGKWKTRSNHSQYQGVNSEQRLSFNLIEVTEQAGEINKPQLDAVKVNKLTEQTDATADADLAPHFVANIAQQALKDQPNRPLDLPAQQTAVIQLPAISGKTDFTSDKSVDSSATILASVIKTIEPNIKLPDNSLFKLTPDSDSQYLIETDPRFTHHKKWLSSIEVVTHAQLHKRLADGYYEQRLVREQLMELTGQRRLANYQSDEQQYRALLTSGVTYGKQYNLTPGIALSPAQMANLTSDMVWMVNKEVLLPNGRIEKVSVPQLYVRARQGDLNGNGALLAGANVSADITAKLLNSGEIASRQLTDLQSETIHHSGHMQAKTVELKALKDIHNLGGQIGAADRVSLAAGGDIRSETAQLGDGQSSWLDRPASIYVTGDNGQLTLKARQGIKLTASQIANLGAGGKTDIQAGQNIQLATRNVRSAFDYTRNSNNYYRGENATEIGTHIQMQGDLALSAGQDLSARAANLSSGGALSFNIGRDIHITSGVASSDYAKHSIHTDKGFLSSTTTERHHQLTERSAISSRFSGHSINATAGNEIDIHASNLFGTNSVTLKAGAQLNVSTSDETLHETHISKTHNSGLMSTDGLGFSLGANRQKITHDTDNTQKKGSVIGSMAGNVTLTAGAQGTIAGSELIAAKDITITGSDVTITAAENSRTDISRLTTQASGLTLSLGGTTGSALDSMVRTAKSAKQEEDSQLAALKGMKAGLQGVQAGQAARLAAAQGKMPSVAINLSYGRRSSQSTIKTEQNTASGSRLSAGDNLTLTATGRKESSQGHLTVEGSQLAADKNISLLAKNNIDLTSASNRQKVNSKNTSQGLSMGIGYGTDGWSANVGANKSQGFEKGNSQFFTDSQLNAGQQLTIESGQDTRLTGAQVSGETVKVDVGGNLRLTSQQLIDKYAAQQTSSSLGASISQGGGGSLNVYANKSELHSDYQSVDKQTAINAGQGGFAIRVDKHTQLDGAVIGSTAEADKNKLDTGTLGFGASTNRAEYKVDSQSGGFSSGGATVGEQFVTNAAGSLLTNMNNQGKASNTSHAAVSEGQLIIRHQDKQQQEVANLSRDVDKAHVKLKPIFDKQQAQKQIEQNQLLGELGQQLTDIAVTEATIRETQAVNENTSPPTKEQRNVAKQALEQQGKTVSDSAIDNYIHDQAIQAKINGSGWGVGGTNRRIVEAGTALIQGLANGDVNQAVANASAPYIANQIGQHIGEDNKAGRLAAHGIANVALALAKGENAAAQSVGAMTAEAVGMLSVELYKKQVSQLTEDEKATVSAFATLSAGIAGGLIGGDSQSAVNSAQAGKASVENNFLSTNQLENFAHKARTCVGDECQKVIRDMVDTNVRQQEEIKAVCSTSPEQCQQKYGYLVEQWEAFDTTIKNLAKDKSLADEFRNYMPAAYMLGMEAEGITVEHGWTKRFEAMGFDAETAQMIATTLPAMINGGSGKGGKGTTGKQTNTSKVEAEKKALEKIGRISKNAKGLSQKEANSVYNKQLIKNAEKISTAKPGQQTAVPRDLNEQTFWKEVQANPTLGSKLLGMNKDPRFPASAGFQKMEAKHRLPDGQTITIHYQYNSTTGKAYDMKIITSQRVQQDPKQVIDTIKDKIK